MDGNKKKNSGKIPKIIKNNMTDIRNVEKIATKEKLKLRCKCQHVDESGRAVLFRADGQKSDITDHPLFVCRLCGSYLDIQEISEDELNRAIDTICRASDIIKMRLMPEKSEDDLKNYTKVWKNQYFIKDRFADLFKAARRRANRRRSGGGGDGFISGRPMTHS